MPGSPSFSHFVQGQSRSVPGRTVTRTQEPSFAPFQMLRPHQPPKSVEETIGPSGCNIAPHALEIGAVPAFQTESLKSERTRCRVILEAIVAHHFGLSMIDFSEIVAECDSPSSILDSVKSTRLLNGQSSYSNLAPSHKGVIESMGTTIPFMDSPSIQSCRIRHPSWCTHGLSCMISSHIAAVRLSGGRRVPRLNVSRWAPT